MTTLFRLVPDAGLRPAFFYAQTSHLFGSSESWSEYNHDTACKSPTSIRMSSDLNVLIGFIAVSNNIVRQDAIVHATNMWTRAKHRKLGDILLQEEEITKEQLDLLNALVKEKLDQNGGDPIKALASMSSVDGVRKAVSKIEDEDIQYTMTMTQTSDKSGSKPTSSPPSPNFTASATGPMEDYSATLTGGMQATGDFQGTITGGTTPSTTSPNFSSTVTGGSGTATPQHAQGHETMAPRGGRAPGSTGDGRRFRIIRPHAKGGLGEVFLAQDQELNREVALKEILSKHSVDPDTRGRFLLEAEITGGLEHPGIVPVYGLGTYADGRPYYAMRFIQGDSLKEAIAAFHDKPHADEGERNVLFRNLLKRFVDVCNAIGYAHSRGVLHRDLKPGNIMIGKYGETLVVDWGLAKPIGDQSAEKGGGVSGDIAGEKTIQPTNTGSYEQTVQGTAIGTPAFMSPEQAEGRLDIIGKASDIYSLGATLYVLVVGQLPINGKTIDEFMGKVKRGEFTHPIKVKASVPAALNAIIVKSMALKPEDRYASAIAMGADIEHYLADEPVTAYVEPWTERARRWARKHRTYVMAAAVMLVTSVVALTAGLFFVNAEKNRTIKERNEKEIARAAEQVQREKAEAARNAAMDALDAMTSNFTRESLITQQEITPEQRKFLEEAESYYLGLMKEEGASEDMRKRRAQAAFRVGTIERRLARNEEAEVSFERAASLYEGLVNEKPSIPEYRFERSRAFNNIGLVRYLASRYSEATVPFTNAVNLQKELAEQFPKNPEYTRQWARSLTNLGNTWRAKGDTEAALSSLNEAVGLQTKLVAEYPKIPEYRNELAGSLSNLAISAMERNRAVEAEPLLRRAMEIREKLRQEFPNEAQYQEDLAKTRVNLASAVRAMGKTELAIAELRLASEIYDQLQRTYPSMPQYQANLASALYSLGDTLNRVKSAMPTESAEVLKRAIESGRQLAARYPKNADYRSQLARSLNMSGNIALQNKQIAEAGGQYSAAIEIQEKLVADFPKNRDYRADLGLSLNNRGVFNRDAGQAAGAEKDFRASIVIQEKLIAEFPIQTSYQFNQVLAYRNLADLLTETKTDEAITLYDKGVALAEAIIAKAPNDTRTMSLLKEILSGRKKAFEKKKDVSKAAADAARIDDLDITQRLRNARGFVMSGRVADVLPALAELGKRPGVNVNHMVEFARNYALAASKDRANAGKHTDEAVNWLRQAAAKGGVDLRPLESDADFAAIREKPEFVQAISTKK